MRLGANFQNSKNNVDRIQPDQLKHVNYKSYLSNILPNICSNQSNFYFNFNIFDPFYMATRLIWDPFNPNVSD